MHIKFNHPKMTHEFLGPLLPSWMDYAELIAEPISATLNELYAHGGGWRPFSGFTLEKDNSISYPGNPTFPPLATFIFEGLHAGEVACLYQSEWVAVIQPDRSFEICRMD